VELRDLDFLFDRSGAVCMAGAREFVIALNGTSESEGEAFSPQMAHYTHANSAHIIPSADRRMIFVISSSHHSLKFRFSSEASHGSLLLCRFKVSTDRNCD
jgi:hypothetical protein